VPHFEQAKKGVSGWEGISPAGAGFFKQSKKNYLFGSLRSQN
jgi:hypothetical protein